MKKIVLALAVVFSVALVSCGNKNAENAEETVAVEEVAEEVVEESAVADSAAPADSAAVVVEEAVAE